MQAQEDGRRGGRSSDSLRMQGVVAVLSTAGFAINRTSHCTDM